MKHSEEWIQLVAELDPIDPFEPFLSIHSYSKNYNSNTLNNNNRNVFCSFIHPLDLSLDDSFSIHLEIECLEQEMQEQTIADLSKQIESIHSCIEENNKIEWKQILNTFIQPTLTQHSFLESLDTCHLQSLLFPMIYLGRFDMFSSILPHLVQMNKKIEKEEFQTKKNRYIHYYTILTSTDITYYYTYNKPYPYIELGIQSEEEYSIIKQMSYDCKKDPSMIQHYFPTHSTLFYRNNLFDCIRCIEMAFVYKCVPSFSLFCLILFHLEEMEIYCKKVESLEMEKSRLQDLLSRNEKVKV